MASDSSSVDRKGIVVTTVLCPHCDGKYPTEDRLQTVCIYCKKPFDVASRNFELESVRVPVIAKYCLENPRNCRHVCSRCHKAHLARSEPPEEPDSPQEYWWQKY